MTTAPRRELICVRPHCQPNARRPNHPPKTTEFKIYPVAPHGFHADYRASYRWEVADHAWNPMHAWPRKYKVLS